MVHQINDYNEMLQHTLVNYNKKLQCNIQRMVVT